MSGIREQEWPNEGAEPTPRSGAAHAERSAYWSRAAAIRNQVKMRILASVLLLLTILGMHS